MAVIEMTESLQRVGEQPLELSVEERNLLSVAYGSTTGCRRTIHAHPYFSLAFSHGSGAALLRGLR